MRTGLFCLGLFGGFSLRNSQFINNTFFNHHNHHSTPSLINNQEDNDHQLAFAAGIQPRAAQEIEHFRDVGWFKGRRRPFAAKFRNFVLGDIIPLTHDVALFRFLLPEEDDEFHLKPCSTLQARVTYSGGGQDTIQRFYTPVTQNGTKGYFDIIVKRKQEGRMTAHLFGMRVGDVMQFRNVMFKLAYRANRWDEVGMIAGGTGFTPMLQVINHALKPVEDPYEIKEREEREEKERAILSMRKEVENRKMEMNTEVQKKWNINNDNRKGGQLDKSREMKTEQVDGEITMNVDDNDNDNDSTNKNNTNSSSECVMNQEQSSGDNDQQQLANNSNNNEMAVVNDAGDVVMIPDTVVDTNTNTNNNSNSSTNKESNNSSNNNSPSSSPDINEHQRHESAPSSTNINNNKNSDQIVIDDTLEKKTTKETLEQTRAEKEWDVPIAPPELQPSKYNPLAGGGFTARNDGKTADGQKRENPEAQAAILRRTADAAHASFQRSKKLIEDDRTKLSLLFCNRTENHILLKTLFEKLAREHPDRFRVKFCVDQPIRPDEWEGYVGYVTKGMIRDTMPPPTKKRSIVLLCGPDHLLQHVAGSQGYVLKQLSGSKPIQPTAPNLANLTNVGGLLGDLGYTQDNVYKF